MKDEGIKTMAGIYFNILISFFAGVALLIIAFLMIQISYTVSVTSIFGIRYTVGGGYILYIVGILLITIILSIVAFAGNFAVVLCARSIESSYDAFFISGLSGTLTFIMFGLYFRSSLLLILLMLIGLIFGLMGSIAFILLDKEYLDKTGIPKNKRVPFSTAAIAVFILAAGMLIAVLCIL